MIDQAVTYYSKLTKRQKVLLIVTAVIVGFAIMNELVLGPIFSQLSTMDAEIHAKSQTIKRSLRYISLSNSVMKDYDKFANYISDANKAQEEIIADHLREIENLANAHQVSIAKIESGNIEDNPLRRKYEVTIESEGALSDILAFMNDLEDSEYLFQINNYRLNPKTKQGDVIKAFMNVSRILVSAEGLQQLKNSSGEQIVESESASENSAESSPANSENE